MVSRTLPPPTSLVGDEMTCPRSTLLVMMVPVIGARTSVSSMAMRAVSTSISARITSALALATASCACSYSCSVIEADLNSSFERDSWDSAVARRARMTSSWASAWASRLRGTRWSTRTSSWPRCTTWPVSTCISRISPEALDFTSTIVSGSTEPAARTATTMLRWVTGTDS